MAKYNFYQDNKCTVWERTHFQVEADSEEEAREIAKKMAETGADPADHDNMTVVSVSEIFETKEYMYPEDNGGQATTEVYINDPTNEDNFIADNSEKE